MECANGLFAAMTRSAASLCRRDSLSSVRADEDRFSAVPDRPLVLGFDDILCAAPV
jgi:hypothetical protein